MNCLGTSRVTQTSGCDRALTPRSWASDLGLSLDDEAPPPRVGRIAEDDRSANARRFADALYNEREREQRKPLRRAGRGRLATAHELLDECYLAEE